MFSSRKATRLKPESTIGPEKTQNPATSERPLTAKKLQLCARTQQKIKSHEIVEEKVRVDVGIQDSFSQRNFAKISNPRHTLAVLPKPPTAMSPEIENLQSWWNENRAESGKRATSETKRSGNNEKPKSSGMGMMPGTNSNSLSYRDGTEPQANVIARTDLPIIGDEQRRCKLTEDCKAKSQYATEGSALTWYQKPSSCFREYVQRMTVQEESHKSKLTIRLAGKKQKDRLLKSIASSADIYKTIKCQATPLLLCQSKLVAADKKKAQSPQ